MQWAGLPSDRNGSGIPVGMNADLHGLGPHP